MKTDPCSRPEGVAVVYCQGGFNTTYGKTAHGLVRFTRRYRIHSVVDSTYAGRDAGLVLDGRPSGIPVVSTIAEAVSMAGNQGAPATHMVMGLATDGGVLTETARKDVAAALELGLNVDSGLHQFIGEDAELVSIAARTGAVIRDVRKPPERSALHFFSGKIDTVDSLKIAVLGTDSAVGKRTTAWKIVQGFEQRGNTAELIGTGQTAWMQGARYGICMDSLVNDFVAGEIEHAVWSAWNDRHPDVIVVEGQGSLMNPAYPGGFEIMAAARPDQIVLQHAPARKEYDGFPGYPVHGLARQIQAIELLSSKPVVAVAVNHEEIPAEKVAETCAAITRETGLPAWDVLIQGASGLVETLATALKRNNRL